MTAPTEAEIRDAIAEEWTRGRPEDLDTLKNRQDSLRERVLEQFGSDMQYNVVDALWADEETEQATAALIRRDDLIDEELRNGVFLRVEQELLEAVATGLRRWSEEFPDAPRAGDLDPRWRRVEPQLTEVC